MEKQEKGKENSVIEMTVEELKQFLNGMDENTVATITVAAGDERGAEDGR